MKSSRSLPLLLVAALGSIGLVSFSQTSSAAYVVSSHNSATVRAAADWTPPTATVSHPGAAVQATTTISMTATDAESGIASVTLERQAPDTSDWVTVCTDSSAPYSCAWDTRPLADGQYALRARATDTAGYVGVSGAVRTTVANHVRVALSHPGDVVRGTVPLSTVLVDAGSVAYALRIEVAPTGTAAWTTVCTAAACSWSTSTLANGRYDLRAVATSGTATHLSPVVGNVLVDNAAPSITVADPGSPLSGTRIITATASDPHSGVKQVVLQYAAQGGGSWKDICTATSAPYSCQLSTAALADGPYSLRAIATDVAGNSTTSAPVTSRVVDNTAPTLTMVDPGSPLTGTRTFSVGNVADTGSGVARVVIQYAATGTADYQELCTVTAAPWSCTRSTNSLPDGRYDFRALATDQAQNVGTSQVVANRVVDNGPALAGLDVQTANGGSAVNRIDAGDTITFTFNRQVNLSSIVSGWDGRARAVQVKFNLGFITNDSLEVVGVNLGSVNLAMNYVQLTGFSLSSTMTATTQTSADGRLRTVVTIRLDENPSSARTRVPDRDGTLVWSPSGAVTDLLGRLCATTAVTESGSPDKEF